MHLVALVIGGHLERKVPVDLIQHLPLKMAMVVSLSIVYSISLIPIHTLSVW